MSGHPSAPPPSYAEANTAFSNPQFGAQQPPYPPTSAVAPYPPPQPASDKMGGNYNTAYSGPDAYGPPVGSTTGYTGPAYDPEPAYSPPQGGPLRSLADEPKPEDHMSFGGMGFSDKAIRRAFIRKVYLILLAQLLVTVAFICLFIFVEPIQSWIQGPGSWFYWVSYGTFFVTYIVLVCIPAVRRKTPGNYICLAVFTFAFSYMVATISSFYSTNIVLISAGITALVCLSISLFAIQTKIDFTMCSGLLFVLVMVLFFFGWSCLITFYTVGYNRILDCVYGGLAALVFGLFLIYDTQMIVGGRKYELSPEEYIYGALQLYIDIVYLFLIILSLFGKSN